MNDREWMELAIREMEKCKPGDESLVPKVGAVIVANGQLIGQGHRGTGQRLAGELHLPGAVIGIEMSRSPKGLDIEAEIDVDVETPPKG